MARSGRVDLIPQLDLAEMSAPGRHHLTRPLQEGSWFVREVHKRLYLDRQKRHCLRMKLVRFKAGGRWLRGPPNNKRVRSDTRVLDAFVALSDATDTQVLRFARRFGALEMCKHGMSFLGHVVSVWEPRSGQVRVITECHVRMELQPTDVYRKYAREIRALLRVAASLHRGRQIHRDDWQVLKGTDEAKQVPDADAAREAVEIWVGNWLSQGRVQPTLGWNPETGADIKLWGFGLWGAIARQLAFAVARIDRWAICHGCGEVFVPTRKPRSGSRIWCSKRECKRAARRRAQRAYKRRVRATAER